MKDDRPKLDAFATAIEPANGKGNDGRNYSATKSFDMTVVVVNYNTASLLTRMFSALNAASSGLNIETIVVDNASRDNSLDVLKAQFPDTQVIANAKNVGFGRANNQAVPFAHGRYILLLNTDAFVAEDTLKKTVDFLDANKEVGVLGVKLISEDGDLQPSCRYFPTPWNMFATSNKLGNFLGRIFTPRMRKIDDLAWDHGSVRECDWVPGCYFAIRREVVQAIGLFDPRFFLYYEEIDYCKAVRKAGWKVVYFPETSVIHIGGESAATDAKLTVGRQISELSLESQLLYFRKHFGSTGAARSVFLEFLSQAVKTSATIAREKRLRPVVDFFDWAKKWEPWYGTRGSDPTLRDEVGSCVFRRN